MGEPIGPGDWVECVIARPDQNFGPCGLVLHGLYQVERTGRGQISGAPVLWLVGHRHPGTKRGTFGLTRFRPIYRPKRELIENLETFIKVGEPAS